MKTSSKNENAVAKAQKERIKMIFIGLSLIVAGLAGSNTTGITGSFIGAVGVVLFIITKVRIWWRHK